MSFRFVLGRAGTGKTRYCLEAVARELRHSPDGPPLMILVPEQATFQMDRALVAMEDLLGSARARVLSFRRLAWWVFSETGGACRPSIDEVGKTMALRLILLGRKDELRAFGGVRDRSGFLKRLASTLSELEAYRIGPREFRAAYEAMVSLGRGETFLAGKLHDLAVVAQDLRDYLAGRFSDPDDHLALLASKLAERPPFLDGARVWVDSFAGFTPQELAVLASLAGVADEVTVTLCLDPADLPKPRDPLSTFRPTLKTFDALTAAAGSALLPAGGDGHVRLEGRHRFRASPALAHLEMEYPKAKPAAFDLSLSVPASPRPARPGPVVLVAAETRPAEVAAAAREMARLVREEGYRWREMSIVTRTLDPYADLLQTVLDDHRIPFFLDRRRLAAHHPVVEAARSAFEAALSGLEAEPLFRLLKTDLWPLAREDVDILENYVLAHGVRGKAWTRSEPWAWRRLFALEEDGSCPPEEMDRLARVESLRKQVLEILGPFLAAIEEASSARGPVSSYVAALWNLAEKLEVRSTLETWIREARSAGANGAADEHEHVWGAFVSLLDQLTVNLGEMPVSAREFLDVLAAGLETLAPGLVPPTLDQVVVGAIGRSRQPDVRAVFVLGANEGVFPAPMSEDIVFDDKERDELEGLGLELSPSSRERTLAEDYLVYIALTRASERLWISYSLADDSGRVIAPSILVRRVQALFPGLEPLPARLEPKAGETASEGELLSGMVRAFRNPGAASCQDLWAEAYNWFVRDDRRREKARVGLGLGHPGRVPAGVPRRLDPELAAQLYGETVRVSVSRLEAYAACPFSHFAGTGLGLERRPVRELKAPEIGTYYHAVLSQFSRALAESHRDLGELEPEAVSGLIDAAVDELEPKLASEVLRSTAANRYLSGRLRRTIGRTVDVLREHAKSGSFRPLGTELSFTLEAETGDDERTARLALRGVVDRLEAVEADGVVLVRVFDFKSSPRKYDVRDTYHGLGLQLPVYLLAATEPRTEWETRETMPGAIAGRERGARGPAERADSSGQSLPLGTEPAGAFFFPVMDPFVRAEGPLSDGELEVERYGLSQVKGFVLADPGVLKLMGGGPGRPPLLPVVLRKDGRPAKVSGAIPRHAEGGDPRSMSLLLEFTRQKVAELARRMSRGECDVAPARRGHSPPACAYCDYRAVCRFDPQAGDSYRRLAWGKPEDFWSRMAEEVGDK